ncbi:lipase family protein [Halopseudomonas pelagia]|uniref:lipase family protein n=1 Tax=Halopseudomonas pelagia TaxID=553151 RepID=UPI0030D91236|tara:strand:- start:358956 stop:361127 length:2172 start_codon:yes stop_codon:yes gene_type:complete
MNELPNSEQSNTLECPLRKQWVSFRLVDEFAESHAYAGLKYSLRDSQNQIYEGVLDSDGFVLIEEIYSGPMLLTFSSLASVFPEPWYEQLAIREDYPLPLTDLQIAAEQSPIGPRRNGESLTFLAEQRAAQEGARFFRVEVSDLVEAIKHLPDPDEAWGPRPSAGLKQAAGAKKDQPGIALEPNQYHVLEVKALRAYSPIFSTSPHFSALNAYHLAVMSVLSYAPFSTVRKGTEPALPPPYLEAGSIGNVLREQLACQIKPTLFNAAHYHLLSEEVPYSKRLEVVPFDPERYPAQAEGETPEDEHFLHDEATDTQAFITHNDKVILISIRGSASTRDWLRDFDARQVPIVEGIGNAHRGFHDAFIAAKAFINSYLDRFHTNDQTIIVCGHSLGGSIALLLADGIKRLPYAPKVILYTYGAPRAGDSIFVESAKDLVHHRIINNNDLVPSVPATWMDSEWKIVVPSIIMLLASLAPPIKATSLLLAGLINLKGDPYEHHGEQHYFMPRKHGGGSEASILWQPGCRALEEGDCARFIANLSIEGDMAKRRSFFVQIASAPQHFSDSGYARAALTTLLRWNASLSREGQLFTKEETEQLRPQMTKLERELADWVPGSYEEFRHQIRLRHDFRFYNKTETELRTLYSEGINSASGMQIIQRRELTRAQQRLTAQASIPITAAAVFGDQAEREDLIELMTEWRQEELNREAERLARQEPSSSAGYQYG